MEGKGLSPLKVRQWHVVNANKFLAVESIDGWVVESKALPSDGHWQRKSRSVGIQIVMCCT
jgi:hypothetical protein